LSKPLFVALAAVAGLALAPAASHAHDYTLGSLHIDHPWAAPAPPGAPTMAGYLGVTNHGRTPDHLLGGSSPDLTTIEVHEMSMSGQIMRMRPIAGGLAIGPGQTVTLSAGGDRHLMLVGPKRTYKVGERIPATLRFEKAGTVKVEFAVQAPGAHTAAPMHMGMH
jgi:copper(I)-binding protein